MESYYIDDKGISLTQFVSRIAELYFHALAKSDSADLLERDNANAYINKVKRAYDKLVFVEKLFINNDFFYQEYPEWWVQYYTKSTYYRIRNKSMNDFKEAFICED